MGKPRYGGLTLSHPLLVAPLISPHLLPRWGLFIFTNPHYFRWMDEIIKLSDEITKKRGLRLILTKDKARQSKTDLIARLILNGPLFVVSGDEWLPAYELSRMVRAQTTKIREVMNRLRSVRASTCFRLFDSLASIPSNGEPILALELLHTFYDSDISLSTRLLRLRQCCQELKRLAFYRPVIAMIREIESEDYETFYSILSPITDRTVTLGTEVEPFKQPALF
jgi:hypothetical protein